MKRPLPKALARYGRRVLPILVLSLSGGVPLASIEQAGSAIEPADSIWIRAGVNTNNLRWGIPGRLLWGLPPSSGKSSDGPRGLIRLYYPVLTNGTYDLINFIAVEPVVTGRKGYSELEPSQLDGQPGKRLWVLNPDDPGHGPGGPTSGTAGQLTRQADGIEVLTVLVGVERFLNGAHVTVTIEQRSNTPDEIQLTVKAEPDSARLDYCILTATMGNKARTRHLWLHNGRVSSLDLFPDFREAHFTAHEVFPLERLHQTRAGDLLVAVTTDEKTPWTAAAPSRAPHWYYGGTPVTQYWRKQSGTWNSDVQVAVNGRYTYWMSNEPIPGGVSFENFELRERFRDGQTCRFGITLKSPSELGL